MPKAASTFAGHVVRRWRAWLKAERTRHALARRLPGLALQEDVQVISPHLLQAGRGVQVQRGTILHCGGRSWSRGAGSIVLGDDVVIGPYGWFLGAGGITVGARVRMGGGVMVLSSEEDLGLLDGRSPMTHYFAPVVIEDDAIVGSQVLITPGVRVGQGALLGAGALVRADVPPYAIMVGRPARQVGDRRTAVHQATLRRLVAEGRGTTTSSPASPQGKAGPPS